MNKQIVKINGLKEIDGMKFHDIEGGFGEGKKAMLVKEIANIHGRELKVINQAINMNRNRFNENIDIVDLKSVNQIDRDLLNNLGFSNSSIANANNIYLLSERGYAKLLKILEDDVAWEQYEKLVDGYFNMRGQAKPTCIEDVLIQSLQEMKAVKQTALEAKEEAAKSREEIQAMREAVTLDTNGWRKETATLINKIANKLGGFEHIRNVREESYKLLNETYGVDINRRLKNKQKNMALEGVSRSKINKVNVLDVIAEDKKLLNGYINIVTKMAIRYGVA